MLVLLLLLLGLGLRLVCITLALILLPLHHVVKNPGESGLRSTLSAVPGVGRSNNPRARRSTLRRPHQGVEKGGTRGPDLTASNGGSDVSSGSDGMDCRYGKIPMVGGWRPDWTQWTDGRSQQEAIKLSRPR